MLELPGQSFFTHRFILAARSPHFRALFAERAAHSQEGDIEFDDHGRERIILPATLSPVVLQAVLKYMYTDCVTVDGSDVSTMTSLMEAAAAFELQDLRLQCESKVVWPPFVVMTPFSCCCSTVNMSHVSLSCVLHIYLFPSLQPWYAVARPS